MVVTEIVQFMLVTSSRKSDAILHRLANRSGRFRCTGRSLHLCVVDPRVTYRPVACSSDKFIGATLEFTPIICAG